MILSSILNGFMGGGGGVLYIEIACDFLDRTQHHKLVKFDTLYIRMLVSVNKIVTYLDGFIVRKRGFGACMLR